jgi:hypothetical protein
MMSKEPTDRCVSCFYFILFHLVSAIVLIRRPRLEVELGDMPRDAIDVEDFGQLTPPSRE